jgi:hypothetical protein
MELRKWIRDARHLQGHHVLHHHVLLVDRLLVARHRVHRVVQQTEVGVRHLMVQDRPDPILVALGVVDQIVPEPHVQEFPRKPVTKKVAQFLRERRWADRVIPRDFDHELLNH